LASISIVSFVLTGCKSPEITAVNLTPNSKEPEGIPYYLPKPYLFVSKNVRYISAPILGPTGTVSGSTPDSTSSGQNPANGSTGGNTNKTGSASSSTGTGSGKSGSGSSKTNSISSILSDIGAAMNTSAGGNNPSATSTDSGTNSPPGQQPGSTITGTQTQEPDSIAIVPPTSISDGLIPQEFFSYQIIYLPDLTQKYGLRIKGGSGELKATADLVNGWMFTGPGPFDVNDSTTAQNVTATGQAIGSVAQSVGQIALNALGIPSLGGGSTSSSGGAGKTTGAQGSANSFVSSTSALPNSITNYAELYVFEMVFTNGFWTFKPLNDGNPIVRFDRDVIALEQPSSPTTTTSPINPPLDATQAKNLQTEAETFVTTNLASSWTFPATGLTISFTPNNSSEDINALITLVNKAATADPKADLTTLTNDVYNELIKFANNKNIINPTIIVTPLNIKF
jgi:hypothetical protein